MVRADQNKWTAAFRSRHHRAFVFCMVVLPVFPNLWIWIAFDSPPTDTFDWWFLFLFYPIALFQCARRGPPLFRWSNTRFEFATLIPGRRKSIPWTELTNIVYRREYPDTMMLCFENGKRFKISTYLSSSVQQQDYNAVQMVAEQALRQNARAS